ncbi:UNVERIFIED_CONTAM: hypothetical protein K2H54_073197 [Gekko kuhli]
MLLGRIGRPLPSRLARLLAAGNRPANRGDAAAAFPAGLQYTAAAARGRREAAFERREFCPLPLPPPASRGRCGDETRRLQFRAVACRGQERGGHVAGKSWLTCPKEETPRDPPARLPKELHLWPHLEHAGRRHHRSHEGRSQWFGIPTATAMVAAGVALCYSKSHASKEEALLEAARTNNVSDVDR